MLRLFSTLSLLFLLIACNLNEQYTGEIKNIEEDISGGFGITIESSNSNEEYERIIFLIDKEMTDELNTGDHVRVTYDRDAFIEESLPPRQSGVNNIEVID